MKSSKLLNGASNTMNYFVITFQYWNQNEPRIIKTSEACPFKIHTEMVKVVSEVFDEYMLIQQQSNNAWNSGDNDLFWAHRLLIDEMIRPIKVLDFEVKFDDFISDDNQSLNGFEIQTLTEWAEELFLEQNQ